MASFTWRVKLVIFFSVFLAQKWNWLWFHGWNWLKLWNRPDSVRKKLRYYYGIRPLRVFLLLNNKDFNKGWPYSIVEGFRVGKQKVLVWNLLKSKKGWTNTIVGVLSRKCNIAIDSLMKSRYDRLQGLVIFSHLCVRFKGFVKFTEASKISQVQCQITWS